MMLELQPKHVVAVIGIFCLTYVAQLVYSYNVTRLDYQGFCEE
jgi:hypothetical protein